MFDENGNLGNNQNGENQSGESQNTAGNQNQNPQNQQNDQNNEQRPYQNTYYSYGSKGPEFISNGGSKPPKKKPSGTVIAIIVIAAAYLVLIAVLGARFLSGKRADEPDPDDTATAATEEERENPELNITKDDSGNVIVKGEDYDGKVLKTSEIYKQNVDSIVYIETTLPQGTASGSGFVIDSANGYILTNYHVVEGASEIIVQLYNEDEYNATLIGGDSINDIAVLKIGAPDLKSVTTGNSDKIDVGDDIIVIGNPLGELKYTLTKGVCSAHDRDVNTGEYSINMFQIDAAANSGNSGGPAFDATGAVVGVVSAKYSSVGVEGIIFCIPINDALNIARELIDHGYVTGRPNFGITVSTSDGYEVQTDRYGRRTWSETVKGARIEEVVSGSCAEKAGIKVGDIIVQLGDKDIQSSNELLNAKKNYKAGDTVSVRIYRNNEYIVLSLTFDEYKPAKN